MNTHEINNRIAARHNAIIGDTAGDTLHRAACAASFIARHHSYLADWAFLAETSDVSTPEQMTANEMLGLSLLCETIADALWFEVEGRAVASTTKGGA